MKIIYLDVLIITNFIISLFFLTIIRLVTHSEVKNHRLIISGFIGSASSLLILFDYRGAIASTAVTIIKVVITAVEIAVCFKTMKLKRIAKYVFLYILINLFFAGICAVLWNVFGGKLIYVRNYTVYLDVSLGALIAFTIAAYILIFLWEIIRNKHFDKNRSYKASLNLLGNEYVFPAISDTGNTLTDFYYGKPVVIFYSDELWELLNPEDEGAVIENKLHILPFETINGQGTVYTTKPMTIYIKSDKFSKSTEVCVGIIRSDGELQRCIFNPKILI